MKPSSVPRAERLDNQPPFLDFGLLKGGERPWRLLLARNNLLAEVAEPRTNGWVGQRFYDRGIDFGDDVRRRPLGHTPLEPWQPYLVRRWNIGC
jgi:hypothetical protein